MTEEDQFNLHLEYMRRRKEMRQNLLNAIDRFNEFNDIYFTNQFKPAVLAFRSSTTGNLTEAIREIK